MRRPRRIEHDHPRFRQSYVDGIDTAVIPRKPILPGIVLCCDLYGSIRILYQLSEAKRCIMTVLEDAVMGTDRFCCSPMGKHETMSPAEHIQPNGEEP